MAARATLIPCLFLLPAAAAGPAWAQFTDLTQAAGLRVVGTTWGAALGDLDGDGDLDIYFGRHLYPPILFWNLGGTFSAGLHPSPFSGPLDRHGPILLPLDDDGDADLVVTHGAGGGIGSEANELYRNDGGGTLTKVPGAGGLGDADARARCVAAADADGDGRVDLWIGGAPSLGEPNALFRNDGSLAFSDVAAAVGLDEEEGTAGGVWGDFDDDGDADLLVGGEEFARPSVLWRNDAGAFTDASHVFAPALPVVSSADFGDVDGDGDLDLAACDGQLGLFDTWAEGDSVTFYFNTRYGDEGCDGLTVPSTADTMFAWLRYGSGFYSAKVFLGPSGVHPPSAYAIPLTDDYVGAPDFTPGVDVGFFVWRAAPGGPWEIRCSTPFLSADVFSGTLADGTSITGVAGADLEDAGFAAGGPRVWRNDGGAFAEVTAALGLPDALVNPRDLSWVDFDNDGDLDLHVVDMGTSAAPNAPDALFRNDGGAFADVASVEGVAGGTAGMGDGGVWGDVDDDGDLDLYLLEGTGPVAFSQFAPTRFLRNDGERGRAFLLDLTGDAPGIAAVGAKVTVWAGPLRVSRRVSANSWHGFQDPLRVHAGIGAAGRADSLAIEWPSGATRTFLNPFPGRYAVHESEVPLAVDLAVACSVDDPTPDREAPVTFVVRVTNASGPAVSGVRVTGAMPAGLAFEGASATAGSYEAAGGVWTVGPLATAAAETLAITARAETESGGLTLVEVASLSALAIDRPDTMIANDRDSVSVTVQAVLALSSAADQAFQVGSPPAPIAPITITDDAVAAGITAADDLRIRIPAGFPMRWDATDPDASVTGPAAAKVAAAVGFADGDRTLVLDVVADFAPNDRVTVSGLAFRDFAAMSSPGRLELSIGDDGVVAALDDKTIVVFVPTGAPEELARPGGPALGPAVPSPSRGATTIPYELPSPALVRLRVYDVSGRLVRVLEESQRGAGRHVAVWDGRDGSGRRAAAGVYLYRLEGGEWRRTRKLVLLR
jgi:uncharacterized repeat protein (TIGR01451 family)